MTVVDERATGAGPGRVATPGRAADVRSRRRDAAAVAALVAAVVVSHLLTHQGALLVGMDVATQFIPWFAWMGEQLAAGGVPEWNPTVFSGMPSAGDPLSGWGYLPAMAVYAALPLAPATHVFLITQLSLVAAGVFVLARLLQLSRAAALVSAVAVVGSGFVFQRNVCCTAFVSVEAWLPWVLIGIEWALRTDGPRRVAAWAVAGAAASQVVAGWPGQGTVYAAVLAAIWLVGRAMAHAGTWRDRGRLLAVNAAGLAVAAGGLSAAALLPRLAVNPATNLAGGYPGQGLSAWHGGWWPADWVALAVPGQWHAGATVLLLALLGAVLAWRHAVVWPLVTTVVVALALAVPAVTPVDAPLVAVPTLDRIHTHAPQRVMVVLYPVVALLAGVAVHHLWKRDRRGRALAVALVALLAGELVWANAVAFRDGLAADRNPELRRRIDLDSFYAPSSAGRFLQRQQAGGRIGRYAAFTPIRRDDGTLVSASYFFFWHLSGVQRLEAHNESMPLGLEHVQGYNPIHLSRYDDLVSAANGRGQDYHVANFFPPAFDGGLFSLLNGRWVVMHADIDADDRSLVGAQISRWPVVFADDLLQVRENPDALPRAWLVADARRVAPGDAVELLVDDAVDPRRTALLETDPPPLDAGADGTVRIAERDTDRIVVDVDTSGDALLVLSEIHHPAWTATVDGGAAPVLVANHALRAVPVPAGRHTVVIAHDSVALDAGLAITATTALGLLVGGVAAARAPRRRGRRSSTTSDAS